MDYIRQSLILSLLVRGWDWVAALYRESLLCRCVERAAAMFRRGAVWRFLHLRTGLAGAFRESLFYRLVTWAFNLPPRLLGRVYRRAKPAVDGSLFLRLLHSLGRRTVPLAGVLCALILITPDKRWNNMYSLVFAAALLCLLWVDCTFHPEQRIDVAQVGHWPALFAVVCFLSCLWSQEMSFSLKFVFFHLTCVLVVVVMVSAVRGEEQLLRLLELAAVGLLAAGLYALYQRASGISANASFTDLDANADMPGRVYSFFQNPNVYAYILVLFTPVMLTMAVTVKSWRRRALFAVTAAVSAAALIMTYSRGGWLAFAFGIFVLMLLLCPKWVPPLIIVGVLALPFLPSNITNRLLTIFTGSDSSISSRNYIYSAAVRLIQRNWLLGVGLGTNALKRGVVYYGVYQGSFPFVHCHNIFLEIWGESGIFGLLAFVGAVFTALRDGVRAKRRASTPLLRGIAAGSVAGVAGSMVFGLTDYAWVYPRVMVLFWLLMGVLYCAIKLSKAEVN